MRENKSIVSPGTLVGFLVPTQWDLAQSSEMRVLGMGTTEKTECRLPKVEYRIKVMLLPLLAALGASSLFVRQDSSVQFLLLQRYEAFEKVWELSER